MQVEKNHAMAAGDFGPCLLFGQDAHIGGRRPFGHHDSVMFYRAIRHAAMVPNPRPAGGETRTVIPKRDPGVFNLSAETGPERRSGAFSVGAQRIRLNRADLAWWTRKGRVTRITFTATLATAAAAVLVQCGPRPAPAPSVSAPISPAISSSTASSAVVPNRAAAVFPVSRAELGASWRPDCPVAPEALRRIELDYIGFDGHLHRGDLVVNQIVVDDVVAIFGQLVRLRYPIEKMRNVDHYPGADDELSMEDNNTSAFNCRPLPHSGSWSQHAFGLAVDLNPLINPYIDAAGDLQPKTAGRNLDRRRTDPGLLHNGDAAVLAFTDRGWTWGGSWRNPIDYQHFQRHPVS